MERLGAFTHGLLGVLDGPSYMYLALERAPRCRPTDRPPKAKADGYEKVKGPKRPRGRPPKAKEPTDEDERKP